MVPCKSAAEEVSFAWSHHRILSTDSKVRTALHVFIIDSGTERVKKAKTYLSQLKASGFVQFKLFYQCSKIKNKCLGLQVAKMEIDCNLKTMRWGPAVLENLLKFNYGFFSLRKFSVL